MAPGGPTAPEWGWCSGSGEHGLSSSCCLLCVGRWGGDTSWGRMLKVDMCGSSLTFRNWGNSPWPGKGCSDSPQSPVQPSRTPRRGLQRSWGPLRMEGKVGTDVCLLLGVVLRCFLTCLPGTSARLVRTGGTYGGWIRRDRDAGCFVDTGAKMGCRQGRGRGLRKQLGSDEPPSEQCPPSAARLPLPLKKCWAPLMRCV